MCTVMDLRTGNKIYYSCSPKDAVLSAYAQDKSDWNTWEYEKKYGHLLEQGNEVIICVDFAAYLDGREF